jgi:hypothetical protein
MSDTVNKDAEAEGGATPAPDDAEAQDAALDAVEPERLLDGENEDTAYVDDAVHWSKVYAELLDFKRKLLDVAERGVTSMEAEAESEVKDTDLKVLKAEAARFERRLAFWTTRADQLSTGTVTDSA